MNRLALLGALLLIACLSAPALAQGSRPAAQKKPAKKRLALNKEGSLKLVHKLLIALEKGQVKKAMGMVKTPFLGLRDGKLVKMSAADLEKVFTKEGKEFGYLAEMFRKRSAKRMTALYWGPKSARAKKTAARFPEFKGCGWVGVVYKGKKKRPEEANDPFAIRLVDNRLKVVGLHTDPALSPPSRPGSLASIREAETLAAKGKAAYKGALRARSKGPTEEAKEKHEEAKRLLSEAIKAYNEILDALRKKDGTLPREYEGHEAAHYELRRFLSDLEKMGVR